MHTTHIRQSTSREVTFTSWEERALLRRETKGPASPGVRQRRRPTCHASGSSEGPAHGACVRCYIL